MSMVIDVQAFRRIDDWRSLANIALDYLVVFAVAGLASWFHRIPLTLVALVIIAGRQSALQGLVHSACHFSLFSKKKHNYGLEFLFAYPILDSVPLYRAQHLEHHESFALETPDRFDYIHDTLQLCREGIWARTWVVFVRPLLGHAAYVFVRDTIKTYNESRKQAFKLAIYWIVVLSTAWWFGCLWFVFIYWVVPLVWLYPVLDIWAEVTDHLDARGESRNQQGLFYSALLKGHEMYHAVHHLYPFVPFYRLRAFHYSLRENGVAMENSRGPVDFLSIVYRGTARIHPEKSTSERLPEHSSNSTKPSRTKREYLPHSTAAPPSATSAFDHRGIESWTHEIGN